MRNDDMIATGLQDDRDPGGTDIYGMIPLLSFVDDEDQDEDKDKDDDSGAGSGDEDSELPPLIEPSSIEVEVPEDTQLNDDDEAFQALTARGVTDMFPGEAHSLIKYMRPLTEDEREIAKDPFLNDLRWTDDPSHTDDVLKAGKTDRGMDEYLDDATYGDIHMKSPEEIAERLGTDKIRTPRRRRRHAKIPARLINATVVVGLAKKLTVEHANWLAEQDKKANIPIRPRSYYENVGKLWTKDQLKKAAIPTTSSSDGWGKHPKHFVHAANQVLAGTVSIRSRFSPTLGDQVDMGGWNPFSAAKSAIKTAVKYTVAKPLQYGYKYGKKAVTAPFTYTYKGIKYVGKMAERIALAPIRAIINKFTGKLVGRRASALAKQKGLSAPTAVENASAKNWAKNYVRAKGGKYGGAIASLMGNERSYDPGYGVRSVDITFGGHLGHDLMGLSKTGTAGLILLGPIGLIALLTGLVNTAGPAAPAPVPGTDEATAEEQAAAAQAADDGSADPGADPGTADDGSADPGYADDGSTDSSGNVSPWTSRKFSKGITVEKLSTLSPRQKFVAQKLIQSGRLRLA